jgi:hypothetical protein
MARSEAAKRSTLALFECLVFDHGKMDCFASLAMTVR